MNIDAWMLAYMGPETMLPLASFLAVIGGILLMFWRRVMSISKKLFAACVRRRSADHPAGRQDL